MIAEPLVMAPIADRASDRARRRATHVSTAIHVTGARATAQHQALYLRARSVASSSEASLTIAMGSASRPDPSAYPDTTSYLLASPANARRLLAAFEQSKRGAGTPVSLDELRRSLGLGKGR